ncbi:unnamed protein product [Pylaiella littoralis]
MAWRPGPQHSPGLGSPEYDERDPWIQRFISKTDDDGELFLDVNAMNGVETAAGAIFVELIRQQAERSVSPADSRMSSWMPGHDMGHHYRQHPPAMRVDPPMAQYEPFRRTYVSDPSCIPQLRFANVSDAGADHHKRETTCHWRRAGKTWSRVPRFRKGETAFVHDPNYKPPHTVVDKWYRTEVGSKNSLAGRVEESRWQSCHSMQTGREPRKLNGSRLSLDEKKAGPGPASYHIRDPWEVREVCGAVPSSRMFCKPVRRVRPQTTAFTCAPTGGSEISVGTPAAPPATDENAFTSRHKQGQARPATVAVANAGAGESTTAAAPAPARYPQFRSRGSPRTQQSCGGGGGGSGWGRRPRTKPCADRHPSGHSSAPVARATRARPPIVGPSSFARAERPTITDESRKKEENYGKKAVRLLTREGDVLVTVTRRRESAWGDQDGRFGLRPDWTSSVVAESRTTTTEPRPVVTTPKRLGHDRGQAARGHTCSTSPGGGRNTADGGGGGGNSACAPARSNPTRQPAATGMHAPLKRGSTLEAQAMRLLPDDFAASLSVYREPGRAELPRIFRATAIPLVSAATPNVRVAESINRQVKARANKRGIITSPDGTSAGNDAPPEVDGVDKWRPESRQSEQGAAGVAMAVRAVEPVV